MPRGSGGPLRITIHRSCDTAPSRAVIRTIAVTVPSAPDPGCRGNDSRSPRPALADKSHGFRAKSQKVIPAEPLGISWRSDSNSNAFPRCSSGNRLSEDERAIDRSSAKLEVCMCVKIKRKIDRCNETFARTIYLENFVLEKLHLIRISSEHRAALEPITILSFML